mmetsp:Transcript_77475/g.239182  ORF Transcript_77475/g.239182 Transcript_77475/m.239182 type:complete len:513 (-) Transcript_77475:8-1546(-)
MEAVSVLGGDAYGEEDASGAQDFGFGPRGWATRHGRRKRLAVVMWGGSRRAAAAEAADPHGLGRGLCPGRSVFKRSANKDHQDGWCFWDDELRFRFSGRKQKVRTRQAAEAEAWEALEDLSSLSEQAPCESWRVEDACAVVLPGEDRLPSHPGDVPDEAWDCGLDDEAFEGTWDHDPSDETSSTCPSTAASSEEVGGEPRLAKAMAGMRSPAPLTPWELAAQRARRTIELYRGSTQSQGAGPSVGRRRSRPRRCPRPDFAGAHKALVDRLKVCRTSVEYQAGANLLSPFEQFRWQFLKEHGTTFCSHMVASSGAVSLRAAPLNLEVGEAFMRACQGELHGQLRPAYHGTATRNLTSIYKIGLVIPGQGNDLKVANGSAYGLGIYTAEVSSPALSLGYARGECKRLLVCGVLDSPDPAVVRHAGSAMVVFDPRRVAPLWEATLTQVAGTAPPRPPPAPAPAAVAGGAPKKQHKAAVHLAGVAAFLARRAARRRRGAFDIRNSFALQLHQSAVR